MSKGPSFLFETEKFEIESSRDRESPLYLQYVSRKQISHGTKMLEQK